MTASPKAPQRRVLFVEDEESLSSAYRRYFDQQLVMAFAASGEEASVLLETFDPEVLVLDMRLPDTDGVDLLRRIRARRPDLPVVITTAYASMRPLLEVMGMVHSGFLTKPFELAEIGRASCRERV